MTGVSNIPTIGNPYGAFGYAPTNVGEILDPVTQVDTGYYLAPSWQPNKAYVTGQRVFFAGRYWQASTSFTSGSMFKRANWVEIASNLPGTYARFADIAIPQITETGGLIVPPACTMGATPTAVNPGQYTIPYARFTLQKRTRLRYFCGTIPQQSGNIEIAIIKVVSASSGGQVLGTKMASTGIVTCPTGAFQLDFGSTIFPPGDYLLAVWGDNAVYQIYKSVSIMISAAHVGGQSNGTSAGIAATASHQFSSTWTNNAPYGMSMADGPLAVGEYSVTMPTDFTQVTTTAPNIYNSYPCLATLLDGSLFMTWRHATSEGDPAHLSNGVIWAARTYDEGLNWTFPVQITSDPSGNDCRLGSPLQLANGDIVENFYTTLAPAVTPINNFVVISTDGGFTFGSPILVPSSHSACSSGLNPTAQMDDGTLRFLQRNADGGGSASISTSTDNGRTWGNEVTVITGDSNLAVDAGGLVSLGGTSLLAAFRGLGAVGAGFAYTTKSTDGGATWAAPTQQFACTSGVPLTRLASGTIIAGPFRGTPPAGGSATMISSSTDNGTTWSTPRVVDLNATSPGTSAETNIRGNVCIAYFDETTVHTSACILTRLYQFN